MSEISIIIPTLNEAAHIGRLVERLLRHGGTGVAEIIVVDANSSDQTVQIAAEAGARILHSDIAAGRLK